MRKVFQVPLVCLTGFLVNTFGLDLLPTLGISPSEPLSTDRGRVVVGKKTDYGYTVLTSDSTMLRGNAVWLWRAKLKNKPSVLAYASEEEYYQALADSGVNFVRLCIYSQANDWGGGTNYRDKEEVEFILSYTDKVVDFASKYGMYVMLNYHDVGKYRGEYGNKNAPTMGYLKDFWSVFAPYYKNRTHVFYELVNEPAFGCSNFKDELLDSMHAIHEYVKPLAPETHLSLLCITGAVGKSWDSRTMDKVVKRYLQLHPNSVDWTNASIAFHPYVNKDKVYSSQPIIDVMKDYAVINSEANYPCEDAIHDKVVDADKQCQTVDGELFINQTMERLGVSWNQHKSLGWNYFTKNWPLILEDAREKDYIWFPNDETGTADAQGGNIGEGLQYGNAAKSMNWTYNSHGQDVVLTVRGAPDAQITVVDSKGTTVASEPLSGNATTRMRLPSGVYLVRIVADRTIPIGKMVLPSR